MMVSKILTTCRLWVLNLWSTRKSGWQKLRPKFKAHMWGNFSRQVGGNTGHNKPQNGSHAWFSIKERTFSDWQIGCKNLWARRYSRPLNSCSRLRTGLLWKHCLVACLLFSDLSDLWSRQLIGLEIRSNLWRGGKEFYRRSLCKMRMKNNSLGLFKP